MNVSPHVMMQILTPDAAFLPPNVGAFATLRTGGVSPPPYDDGTGGGGLNLGMHVGDDPGAVAHNRAVVRRMLPAEPCWLNQVHGNRVVNAADAGNTPAADAIVAAEPGLVCAIQTADCLPVLFSDVTGHVVAAAHAGWRGLAGGVLENTLAAMRAAGARNIVAWMGPAIGPLRFEVGEEVRMAFIRERAESAAAFQPVAGKPDKYLANIYQLAQLIMRHDGVRHIYGGNLCTVLDAGRFYSYRRNSVTGRMASLIWIKE